MSNTPRGDDAGYYRRAARALEDAHRLAASHRAAMKSNQPALDRCDAERKARMVVTKPPAKKPRKRGPPAR